MSEGTTEQHNLDYLKGFWHGRLDGLNYSQATLSQLLENLINIEAVCKHQGIGQPPGFEAQYNLLTRYLNVIQQERQRYIEQNKPE